MEKSVSKITSVSELPQIPPDRARFSVWLSKSLWLRFKKATANVGTSAALEVLIRDHLEKEAQKKAVTK